MAGVLGYRDGEKAPVEELFGAAAGVVSVPVTVDAEAGHGLLPREFVERLLATGAVGRNYEDTDRAAGARPSPSRRRGSRPFARPWETTSSWTRRSTSSWVLRTCAPYCRM